MFFRYEVMENDLVTSIFYWGLIKTHLVHECCEKKNEAKLCGVDTTRIVSTVTIFSPIFSEMLHGFKRILKYVQDLEVVFVFGGNAGSLNASVFVLRDGGGYSCLKTYV